MDWRGATLGQMFYLLVPFSRLRQNAYRFLLGLSVCLALMPSALCRPGTSLRERSTQVQVVLFDEHGILGPVFYSRQLGPDSLEYQAARELAEVLSEVSGHDWPVLAESGVGDAPGIYVGHTTRYWIESNQSLASSRDGLLRLPRQSDAYYQHVGRDQLVLAGNTAKASVRAVTRFLMEYLDVRWFIPGELGESVPPRQRLALAGGSSWSEPDYSSRWLRIDDAAWNRHNLLDRWIPSYHNLHRLIDAQTIQKHLQWQPIVRGERRISRVGTTFFNQPEITDESLIRYLGLQVERSFLNEPELSSVSIGMSDSVLFSASQASQAMLRPWRFYRDLPDTSPLVFNFSNRVAEAAFTPLRLPGGKRYVSQLAYLTHLDTPGFSVNDRIAVYVAEDRSQWYDPQRREEDLGLVKRWAESGSGLYGLRDYYYGRPYFIPRIFTQAIAESLQVAHDDGARLFMAESNPRWGFDGPKLWLATQLVVDADRDADRLLDEYYTRFYGPAAEPMRHFFEACEAAWMAQPGQARWIRYYLNPAQAEIFPPGHCETLRGYLDEAVSALTGGDYTEPYRERVALTESSFAYTVAASTFYHAWKLLASNPLTTAAQREEFLAQLPAYLKARKSLIQMMPADKGRASRGMQRFLLALDPRPRLEAENWRGIVLERDRFHSYRSCPAEQTGETVMLWRTRNGWTIENWRSQGNRVEQVPLADDSYAIRVEGAYRFTYYNSFVASPGGDIGIRLKARGKLSPGCQLVVTARWRDAEGELLDALSRTVLPQGEHLEWIPLALRHYEPNEATTLAVNIRIMGQQSGDWAEITDLLLINLPPSEPALEGQPQT